VIVWSIVLLTSVLSLLPVEWVRSGYIEVDFIVLTRASVIDRDIAGHTGKFSFLR